jgi:NADP-dependent 3-hydroxy acid dehydrogenase YdfG
MIDVNLRGVLYGIAAVPQTIRAQQSRQIINVSSTAGHCVYPNGAVYSATKFGVRALSDGLRQESTDVRVTTISPGLTRTELTHGGGDAQLQRSMREVSETVGIDPSSIASSIASAIASAIGYVISQPAGVDVSEVVINPTAQQL